MKTPDSISPATVGAHAILIALACLAAAVAAGAAPPSPQSGDGSETRGATASAEADSAPQPRNRWLWIPVAYYTPETKAAFGAALLRVYRGAGETQDARPSTLAPVFIYTTRSQIVAVLAADLYLAREAWRAEGFLTYSKFPNKFYGTGNSTRADDEEDYTPRAVVFAARLARRLVSDLYAGPQFMHHQQKLTETEAGGLLAGTDVPGTGASTARGAGLAARWDGRDNVFSPRRGGLYEAAWTAHGGALGGDHDFTSWRLDLRSYLPIAPEQTLAVQIYGQFQSGEPPYYLLGLLGGQNIMRGIYEGRYRDRQLLAGQVEYRRPLWRWLGAALFAGAGAVAHDLDDLGDARYRPSLGAGLRLLISRSENINLRLDYGRGDGESGFYAAFGEAF